MIFNTYKCYVKIDEYKIIIYSIPKIKSKIFENMPHN